MNKYLDEFLALKCAGDILNIINPVQSICKEISESMSIIKRIRGDLLENKLFYTIYDLCAGNALTSIILAHLLPVKKCIAIDKRERFRKWDRVNKFKYIFDNIFDFNNYDDNSIVMGIHPCGNLAVRIIDIFNDYKEIKVLYLMPCCVGNMNLNKIQNNLFDQVTKYERWCMYLFELINSKNKSLAHDKYIMSPANIIIKAIKE